MAAIPPTTRAPPETQKLRPAPRLYLVTPRLAPAGLLPPLAALIDMADIAAVLLRLPDADAGKLTEDVRLIAPLVQQRDIAVLLDGHPEVAVRAAADGAQLTGIDSLMKAVGTLKPDYIAGAGGLRTRHDAMLAGESGADYVMFGEPDDERPAFAVVVERVAWWAELFEVPCVGYAASLAEIPPLVAAGADFIAVGEFVFSDSRGPSAMIRAAAALLERPEPVK